MEKTIQGIYQSLQRLIGLHRQLLETVRMERSALASADLKGIDDATRAKEALIAAISKEEGERVKHVAVLAVIWKKPMSELTLPRISNELEVTNQKTGELFRSAYNALHFLIQRIREQNESNRSLVEASLEHIRNMKNNVLGERSPRTETYTSHGHRTASRAMASRLISREA